MVNLIDIRPLGPDYYHFRCLTFGELTPESAATVPEEPAHRQWFKQMRRDGRFFDAHRLLRALCRAYGSAGMLAWADGHVVGHLRFYPQAVLELAGGTGVCLQDKLTAETIRRLSDTPLPPMEKLTDRRLRITCVQVAPRYRQRGIAGKLVEQAVNWASANRWRTLEARGIKKIGPLLQRLPMAPASVFTACGFEATASYHDPVLDQTLRRIREGRYGEAAMEELARLPEEVLCHADVVYELTRAVG